MGPAKASRFAGASHGRQTGFRRSDQRSDEPVAAPDREVRRRARGQGEVASQYLAAGPLGAVAAGDADAVETQVLGIQELGFKRGNISLPHSDAPSSA